MPSVLIRHLVIFSQYRGKCTKQHEFLFFCGTRKYRYRGDTQDVVWRRSIRFWEAQRSYFSTLKPLKWPSDPWVTFGQHLLPKIWPKNGWKSPFSTFLKRRGVLQDEFLLTEKFFHQKVWVLLNIFHIYHVPISPIFQKISLNLWKNSPHYPVIIRNITCEKFVTNFSKDVVTIFD